MEVTTMARKRGRLTKADLEARAQMIKNAEHTRRLAERAQAELDRREPPKS